jgi:tRNA pseudouridine55 synthase
MEGRRGATENEVSVQGFLNLNKPDGMTSHDCVARVRRMLHLRRVGHGGTLDPAATGVLPIAIDRATRLLQFLRQDKAYRAVIRLGVSTTTDDLEGETIASKPTVGLTLEMVKAALEQFQGKFQQVPPNYSAVQVRGKRSYDLARAGKEINVPARIVEVYELRILEWRPGDFPELELFIACGSGTYIRSIARDLGAACMTGGTLASLIRTESSGFKLADSLTFDELERSLQAGTFQPIPPEVALAHLPGISLPPTIAQRWCQGQRIPIAEFMSSFTERKQESLRVCSDDRFLGIGQIARGEIDWLLLPKVVFIDPST